VTAKAQPGNPKPRIFRLPEQQALINRLGFNNDGADAIAQRLAALRESGRWPAVPVGINIGKSRATPLEQATDDYLYSFRMLRDFADYITLNISSPNTPVCASCRSLKSFRSYCPPSAMKQEQLQNRWS
jgi:dihydroorotate dehydrogenase